MGLNPRARPISILFPSNSLPRSPTSHPAHMHSVSVTVLWALAAILTCAHKLSPCHWRVGPARQEHPPQPNATELRRLPPGNSATLHPTSTECCGLVPLGIRLTAAPTLSPVIAHAVPKSLTEYHLGGRTSLPPSYFAVTSTGGPQLVLAEDFPRVEDIVWVGVLTRSSTEAR